MISLSGAVEAAYPIRLSVGWGVVPNLHHRTVLSCGQTGADGRWAFRWWCRNWRGVIGRHVHWLVDKLYRLQVMGKPVLQPSCAKPGKHVSRPSFQTVGRLIGVAQHGTRVRMALIKLILWDKPARSPPAITPKTIIIRPRRRWVPMGISRS